MDKFLTLNYYLNTRPDPDFQYTKFAVLLIALLFLLSIALKIYRKKYVKEAVLKKMMKRYPGRFFTFGSILLILLLAREAGIPFLSMRIWWFALFIYIIYWALKVCLTFRKEYRYRTRQTQTRHSKNKYLPKRKK
jgi:hypothetical protein